MASFAQVCRWSMSTAHDLWLGQAKLRAAVVSRVLLKGVGVVGGGGGVNGRFR